VGFDVDFDAIVDPQPALKSTDNLTPTPTVTTLAEKGSVTVYFDDVSGTRPTATTITVTNASVYTSGSIEWYLNSATALTTTQGVSTTTVTGDTLTVDTTAAPFNKQGTYHLTVIGSTAATNSVPASTVIYITILP